MTKLNVTSNSLQTDFVSSKQRLTKKQPHVDFNLADNDDFFGFGYDTSEYMSVTETNMKLSKTEKVMYTLLAVGVIVYVLQALQFIF